MSADDVERDYRGYRLSGLYLYKHYSGWLKKNNKKKREREREREGEREKKEAPHQLQQRLVRHECSLCVFVFITY